MPIDLPESRRPITKSKLLVVEGMDSFRFFQAFLKHLNLLNDIEIRNFGGVKELSDYLNTLHITPGFRHVSSLGIVRDAEENAAQSAFQSVCSSLKKAGLSVPKHLVETADGTPSISVFILPNCESPGMLETLCLQAVQDDVAIPCVEAYFQCVEELDTLPKNMEKAKLYAFLSSRDRPNLRLGEAADKGYWPWQSPVFNPLKQFLQAL